MVAGAAIGAAAGGAAGKGAARVVNPKNEDLYWREAYSRTPYYRSGRTYDDYAPAYSLGYNGWALGRGLVRPGRRPAQPGMGTEQGPLHPGLERGEVRRP